MSGVVYSPTSKRTFGCVEAPRIKCCGWRSGCASASSANSTREQSCLSNETALQTAGRRCSGLMRSVDTAGSRLPSVCVCDVLKFHLKLFSYEDHLQCIDKRSAFLSVKHSKNDMAKLKTIFCNTEIQKITFYLKFHPVVAPFHYLWR